MDDCFLRASDGLVGAFNQVIACLCQNLNGHIFGNVAAFNKFTNEIEIGLAGTRKANLNFLVAHTNEQLEHL